MVCPLLPLRAVFGILLSSPSTLSLSKGPKGWSQNSVISLHFLRLLPAEAGQVDPPMGVHVKEFNAGGWSIIIQDYTAVHNDLYGIHD